MTNVTARTSAGTPQTEPGQSRRAFLKSTAMAAGTVVGSPAIAAATGKTERQRHPKRGGTLRFATRSDSRGLDPHRNYYYYTSHPLAGISAGLMDIDKDMNAVPGLAEEYSISGDQLSYTFKMRGGTTYHNGAPVDADSVAWNLDRAKNPKIGHSFVRAALQDIKDWQVLDKSTIRLNLVEPNAAALANLIHYPFHLMAPGTETEADYKPVTAGPFKFKTWRKNDRTEIVRHDGWWETDNEGNALPYLDGIVGLPRKDDRVRLTALRTKEVELIDAMPFTDAALFEKIYKDQFRSIPVPQVGTSLLYFNLKNGPFSAKNPHGKLLRQAVAHAVSHEVINQAVFSGQGDIARTGFYGSQSPWHTPDAKPWPEYDPDKARHLVKKAGAEKEAIILTSRDAYAYMHGQGEIVQAMLTEIGLTVQHQIHPYAVLKELWRKGQFHIDATGNSYRIDPDAWYSRSIYSKAASTILRTGYNSEQADKLVLAGKKEKDRKKRLEIYTDLETLIMDDLPLLYTNYVQLMSAATSNVNNYAPTFCGPYGYSNGGVRATWIS